MNQQFDLFSSQPGRKPGLIRVLFVCTGNACRSPMAEGLARHYGMGRLEVFSAGIMYAPLNSRAVRAMAEIHLDIAGHTHTGIGSVPLDTMDLVVTLCDYAQSLFPGGPSTQHRLHWSIDDPTTLRGPDWWVLPAYRKVRDELDERIRTLLATVLT